MEPTIVEAPEDSWLWKKELFVPFVAVAPFDELDDAIEKANDTEYGLTSGFFSEDEAEIDEWLDRVQAGVVYVNRRAGSTTGAWPGVQPFGGWKGSGTTGKAGGGPYYVTPVPARAVADGDRGMTTTERDLTYDALAAHSGPKLITDIPGPESLARIARDAQGHVALAAARLPVRAQAWRGFDRGGRGRQPVPGHQRRDRGHLDRATAIPRVVEAIQQQATQLLHYSASDFYLPIYSDVAERLAAIAPFGGAPARVFLSNSGTEAVEAAIKLARNATGRQYLIGFYQSFHGRSMGSVTLTASKAKYRQNFGPMLPSVYHSFYGDFDYLEEVLFKRVVSPGRGGGDRRGVLARRRWLRAAARRVVPLPA